MTQKLGVFGILTFLSLFFGLPASARDNEGCAPVFSERSVTISLIAVDLGSGQKVAGSEQVTIERSGNGEPVPTCVARIRISRISSYSDFPTYALTAANRPIAPSATETSGGPANEIQVALPAKGAKLPINLQAVTATEWGLEAGRRTERLQMSLVARDETVLDQIPLNIELDVPKAVDVMIVGATGGAQASRVELGNLSSTQTVTSQPFGVRIWSSSPYRFAFESENQGELRHKQGLDAIPYNFFVNQRLYSLDGAPPPLGKETASAVGGDTYSLAIQVPARRSIAGEYQDRLTVSVTAI